MMLTLVGRRQGGSAHIGGVVFPTDEALLDRSLLVGNITSVVNTEQVRPSTERVVEVVQQFHQEVSMLEQCQSCTFPAKHHALLAQLQQLFGFCGTVKDCSFVGVARTYALVEFETEEVCTGLWESFKPCPPSNV